MTHWTVTDKQTGKFYKVMVDDVIYDFPEKKLFGLRFIKLHPVNY